MNHIDKVLTGEEPLWTQRRNRNRAIFEMILPDPNYAVRIRPTRASFGLYLEDFIFTEKPPSKPQSLDKERGE